MKTLTCVLMTAMIALAAPAFAASGGGSWPTVSNEARQVPAKPDLNLYHGPIIPRGPEPTGMTAATKARLTNVAQRVDSLIDQHKCDEATALAKEQGGVVMADMATKICVLRYKAE
ncbi:hypothetical protein [Nitrospirillum pindoramense]|uniref:UrcA family protein n=1 Tax=Nitrospirillum amazonense TaxID=28077 RepID=A0A560HDN8_9PROT|nr:hypothetical protein [Nitrospirillum amazonense]TWB43819.1 hypothetical protein FBZ90_104207 [Nitrospirillum amazonense]